MPRDRPPPPLAEPCACFTDDVRGAEQRVRRQAIRDVAAAGDWAAFERLLGHAPHDHLSRVCMELAIELAQLVRRLPGRQRAAAEARLLDHLDRELEGVGPVLEAATTLRLPCFVHWELRAQADHVARAAAAAGLRRLRDPRGVAIVVRLSDDPDPSVRCAAVESMARWRTEAMLPALVARLEDAHRSVRYRAVRAIGAFGAPGLDAMIAMVEERGEAYRYLVETLFECSAAQHVRPHASTRAAWVYALAVEPRDPARPRPWYLGA